MLTEFVQVMSSLLTAELAPRVEQSVERAPFVVEGDERVDDFALTLALHQTLELDTANVLCCRRIVGARAKERIAVAVPQPPVRQRSVERIRSRDTLVGGSIP